MNKCKTCNCNSEGLYCFRHKPRKPLHKVGGLYKKPLTRELIVDAMNDIFFRNEFFLGIWKKRTPHNCENCGKWLGPEPLSYMFDHLLEKSKYPELKYEEENICYLCLECHDNKTRGLISEKIQNLIN